MTGCQSSEVLVNMQNKIYYVHYHDFRLPEKLKTAIVGEFQRQYWNFNPILHAA